MVKKLKIRLFVSTESTNVTDGLHALDDGIGRAFAEHRAAKTRNL